MVRLQYKVVRHRVLIGAMGPELDEDPDREKILNRYGEDGWELTAVTHQSYRRDYDPTALQGYTSFAYFFKKAAE